jgi:cold shock CspA family protein/ribosome-associated translation inhibitor RaiA
MEGISRPLKTKSECRTSSAGPEPMQSPLQITFRNIASAPAVEALIRERVQALEHYCGRLIGCRVIVEESARRQHQGKLYHVRVDLTVPGREIVIKRDPSEHHAHEDILVAVHDAFDAAQRKLQDYTRTGRGDVKTHDRPSHGYVARLFRTQGYGFIRSSEGDEIYMHRNAVLGKGFDALVEGEEVRYSLHEGEGEKGPRASTVIPVGKHHPAP